MTVQRDRLTTFALKKAITSSAKSDIINLKEIRDIAVGRVPWIRALVTTAFTDAGNDSTLTLKLETDDAEAFGSAVARQTLGTFAALSPVGAELLVPLQINAWIEQFGRLDLAVANGDFTTAAITAYITFDPHHFRAYKTPIGPNF